MSQVKITLNDRLTKKDLLSSIGSLGASFRRTDSKDSSQASSFDIITKDSLHKRKVITEICRRLDTLNIKYEVIK